MFSISQVAAEGKVVSLPDHSAMALHRFEALRTAAMDGDGESRSSRVGVRLDQDGRFDHAVLDVHYGVDAAEQLFRSMGYKVTPRGYHTGRRPIARSMKRQC